MELYWPVLLAVPVGRTFLRKRVFSKRKTRFPPPQISFWLIENGFTVLIAACDTFRAGAVEQLRTHQRRLNSLHPPEQHGGRPVVQLYEKGYGKDAAGIAMEAIAYGKTTTARYWVLASETLLLLW